MSFTDPQIISLFRALDRGRPDRFPPPRALSSLLYTACSAAHGGVISQTELTHFGTASVEMWHRALHSFLIAASLYRTSELWASVAGYYASHYSMRAFAHLFGYFALHRRRAFLEASFTGGRCRCLPATGLTNIPKREHRFYWAVVRRQQRFHGEDLFTENDDSKDESDASHRGYANYMDHLDQFGGYDGCNREELKTRIAQILMTAIDGAVAGAIAIPDRNRYPDVARVLSIGYLRIHRYRTLLDELVGTRGRFWRLHRSPSWSEDLIAFPSE